MENTRNTFIDTSLNLSYSKLHHAFLDDSNQDENQVNLDVFGWNKSHKKEVNGLVEELNRANVENERLTEMLAVVCQNVNGLRNQMKAYVNTTTHGSSKDQIIHSNGARKRKHFEYNNGTIINRNGSSLRDEKYSSCKKAKEEFIKPKIYRVCAPIETSDDTSLIVKDGYLWRKYGQKVTKDNPWPRTYFKCSFAPTCLVKKKVQRSIGDQSVVVATYEGEHNHPLPSHLECKQSASTSITQGSSSLPVISTSQTSSGETITLNLTKPQSEDSEVKDSNTKNAKSHSLQQFLVDQMASSLTRDPTFRAAIAKAISLSKRRRSKSYLRKSSPT